MGILGILFLILIILGSGAGLVFLIVATITTYAVKNDEPRNDQYNPNFDYSAKNIEENNLKK